MKYKKGVLKLNWGNRSPIDLRWLDPDRRHKRRQEFVLGYASC